MDNELATIGERLAAILEAIENYIQATTNERNRNRDREDAPVNVTGKIVGTFGLPEAVEAKRSTDQERYHATQQKIAVGAWGAFIGTLIYVVVAQMTLNQIQMQTAQIYHQSEVDNADASLRAAQWLKQTMDSEAQIDTARNNASAARDNASATLAQARTSREALISVQRAYISFSGQAGFEKIIESGKVAKIRLILPWVNDGVTPTKANATGHINWRLFSPTGI